jgi:hypothetical protein
MKIAEYRELYDRLSYWFVSLRSAATRNEQELEADKVKKAAYELLAANCPRAKKDDVDKTNRLVDSVKTYLDKSNLGSL